MIKVGDECRVAYVGDNKHPCRVLKRKPETKGPCGRCWLEWEHNIKIKKYECEAEDWFHLAQDMDKWRDGAGTSGNVKCGNYLISGKMRKLLD